MPDDDALIVSRLNRQYAIVVEGSDVRVLLTRHDPATARLERARLTIDAFRTLYRHQRVDRGRKSVSIADIWLDHPERATYERVVFNPNPVYVARPDTLNLWQGFPLTPKAGAWDRIRHHLFEIGACGDADLYDFLLDWLTYLVRAPHLSPECAIVWQGAQGAGKGSLVRIIHRLVGQHFLHVTHTRHFAGNFNAHLQDALVVFADEALWAGDKAAEGPLKQLITEQYLIIERKGRDPIMSRNYVHLVMATNNEWAVPMGFDDRRFGVIEVPDRYVDNVEYFAQLHDEIEHGGVEALYWELLNRDIRKPRVPKTAISQGAAIKQKVFTMSLVEKWWYQQLDRGAIGDHGWPEILECDLVHAAYLKGMDEAGNRARRSMAIELGLFLARVVPGLRRSRPRRAGGQRPRCWIFPPLMACRAEFAKLVKTPDLFAAALAEESDLLS